jgi:hypothetical protein
MSGRGCPDQSPYNPAALENLLSPSVVTVLLFGVTGAAVSARFSWRSLFISAGVLEVLGLVLLGLPGAVFLETLEPLMQRVGRSPSPVMERGLPRS